MTQTLCALCLARPAELYCKNDDANLCCACDASYHSSNPLAARHERVPLPQQQCLNDCSSSAACSLAAYSKADSDTDLAVVPDLAAAAECHAPAAGATAMAFDDVLFSSSGLSAPAFSSGDLLDFTSGNGMLDFDLNDLLDFSVPEAGGACEAELLAAPQQPAALVPSFEPVAAAQPLGNATSLVSSQAGFGLLPQPSQELLHMVPQMPASGSMPAPFSQLIPVPSATVVIKQEPQQEVALVPKQAASVVPEQPLTRAERVARYLEKKKRRNFKKVIRYQSRKAYAEVRPRIKGRFATPAEVAALKAAEAAKPAVQSVRGELDDVAVVPVF